MNGSFDPDDVNIPNKLRNRFLSWGTNIPRLQSSQYGPIDKYLNLKFPNAMVKPQGLMRKILSESNLQAIDSGVVLDNDPEQMINEDDSEPKDVDTSITSIDSYGVLFNNNVHSPFIKHFSQDNLSGVVLSAIQISSWRATMSQRLSRTRFASYSRSAPFTILVNQHQIM